MPVSYSDESSGPMTRRNTIVDGVFLYWVDYGTWTKAELQEAAEIRGLSTAGTKADLIERLTA